MKKMSFGIFDNNLRLTKDQMRHIEGGSGGNCDHAEITCTNGNVYEDDFVFVDNIACTDTATQTVLCVTGVGSDYYPSLCTCWNP